MRDIAALVVLHEREQRRVRDEAAADRRSQRAPEEPEPHLAGEHEEDERHGERAPAEEREEERAPPVQEHGGRIREQRDEREHAERDQRECRDLVADARILGRHGAA